MIEILKAKAKKSHLITAVIALAVAIGLLAWTKLAIVQVILGPTKLDITADPASYEGKYVTIDAENFLWDYVEHTTTTTKNNGSKSTAVNGDSYIVFQSVYDYEAGYSTWYFYSAYLGKDFRGEMSDRMDASWEYLNDNTGTVAPPDPMTLKGTWTKMESKMERYYTESLEELGVEESDYDVIYCYMLDTATIGGQKVLVFWIMMAVAAVALLVGIVNVAGAFGNGYMKQINKYLQNNPNVSLAAIESDFSQAHVIAKKVWIGKTWTIYVEGASAMILDNADLIWGYYYRRTGRHSASEMRLFTAGKGRYVVNLSESDTHTALEFYGSEQPQMIVGYSKDLEKTYSKDFNGFLNLKYNPAKQAAASDPYSGNF